MKIPIFDLKKEFSIKKPEDVVELSVLRLKWKYGVPEYIPIKILITLDLLPIRIIPEYIENPPVLSPPKPRRKIRIGMGPYLDE